MTFRPKPRSPCSGWTSHFNPPILHREETFLRRRGQDSSIQESCPPSEVYAKFARLTQHEEKAGLLADPATIGTRTAWLARLQAHRLTLRGHRLVKALAQSAKE
jgi:hypothetical protein